MDIYATPNIDPTQPDSPSNTLHIDADREAASTIWYALQHYKEALQKDLQQTLDKDPSEAEDTMFLSTTLSKVARIQFEMKYNHDARQGLNGIAGTISTYDQVQKWLDVT